MRARRLLVVRADLLAQALPMKACREMLPDSNVPNRILPTLYLHQTLYRAIPGMLSA